MSTNPNDWHGPSISAYGLPPTEGGPRYPDWILRQMNPAAAPNMPAQGTITWGGTVFPPAGIRDPELVAVDAILAALKPLQASARRRVLEYVTARDAETADPMPEAAK